MLLRLKPAIIAAIVTIFVLALPASGSAKTIDWNAGLSSTQVHFGITDLADALKAAGISGRTSAAIGDKADLLARVGLYSDPARTDVRSALASLGIKAPTKPESFVLARKGKKIIIAGYDDSGVMYGLLELAERVRMDGQNALVLKTPVIQSPAVPFRAINPFLTLPFTENEDWWFLSEDYWKGYLDQLARARINWLDIHGMYDFDTTLFPNIYPYFVKSESFPQAGVSKEKADRNLAMLNKVIGMAKDRGIKIAIMSYSTSWNVPYAPKAPYEENEANLTTYTREVVRNIIKACPGLAMIGFRVGESGMEEDFFKKSYIQGVTESGRNIPIYTRSWGAKKSKCMEIAKDYPGKMTVEIKYNGEQLGAPYHLQGGRMAGWRDYSYQDFLSYPKNYDVIWQIRANGTHRVFTWANPDHIRRAAESCTISGSAGFCVEPMNAYYPMKNYFHKPGSDDLWFNWGYERDWFWYELWGRTAYDPKTPEKVWISQFKQRFGKQAGEPVYRLVAKMSEIVPLAFTFYSMGPDHRHHAPELELGGSLADWANGEPFDTQNVQSVREYVKRTLKGDPSARMTPLQAADLMDRTADQTIENLAAAKLVAPADNKEFKCLSLDALALAHLAKYNAAKLRGAVYLAEMEETGDLKIADSARQQAAIAGEMWKRLSEITEKHYQPFMEHLRHRRMGAEYHWSKWIPELAEDGKAIDAAVEKLKANPKPVVPLPALETDDKTGPAITPKSADLGGESTTAKQLYVTASVEDASGVKSVFLKHKKFPSESQWVLTPMTAKGNEYSASIEVKSTGAMYCIEALDNKGNGSLWPDFLKETPYIEVTPWDAPEPKDRALVTPLEFIDSIGAIAPEFAAMVAGRDADMLAKASDKTKKHILNLVDKGLSLIIFEQDFPDRFSLDWLPGGIKGTDADFNSCKLNQPHPLLAGLGDSILSEKIINDALDGGDADWKFLTEPKGLAIRQHGKGHIILSQMRILEGSTSPDCDTLMRNIIKFVQDGDPKKPMLIIDRGNDLIVSTLKNLDATVVFLGM